MKTKKSFFVTRDLFFLPVEKNEFVGFAPLLGKVFLVNAVVKDVLVGLRDGNLTLDPFSKKILQVYKNLGVVNVKDTVFSVGKHFEPVRGTLVPSLACNLSCVYCFSD